MYFYILESSSDSENSSSGNEDVRAPKLHIKPKKKPTKQNKNKKQTKSMELSANEIAKLLVQAVDNGQ